MSALISEAEFVAQQVQREFSPDGNYIECIADRQYYRPSVAVDGMGEDEYESVVDELLRDNRADYVRYYRKDFDPQLWRETVVGYGCFKKNGTTVTAINGIVNKQFSIWTYVTDEHDVVAKCVGRRGKGCQHRSTFSEWVVRNYAGAWTLQMVADNYQMLQATWLRELFAHEKNCKGRNSRGY